MDIDWRKEPNAPAPGTVLCSFEQLKHGVIREFCLGSGEPFRIIVFRQHDALFAYVNQCPHHWLAMNKDADKFLMWAEDEVMCVHHSAAFKLTQGGVCTMGPCLGSNLTHVPLQVIDGQVQIADT